MNSDNQENFRNYTAILREELVPAMGCTEPIAIAYAAAKAKELLGEKPRHITIDCSGNIIKNVKGVTVPNSGGQKGIEVAAVLGITGGRADKELEVIAEADDAARERCKELVSAGFCDVSHAENVPNLYIAAKIRGDEHTAEIVIEDHHTNIVLMKRDGETIFTRVPEKKVLPEKNETALADRSQMTLKGLLDYAEQVDLQEVRDILERQIRYNSAISQEGLDNRWGAQIGKTMLESWGNDVKTCAIAKAAAGSDARMSGCALPVVINSGSGNQGITVTMPVLVYAKEMQLSESKLYRALLVSNLVSIYIKHFIGSLSAFCGAVSAACGAGAAITYMAGGDYRRISYTITNTLGNVGGIVCDGAKPSCAAKIASSVHAAILAYQMSMRDQQFKPGEGIVEEDVEETIRNMGYIGKVGMKPTDHEILNVMIHKVDVNACL
ncbi:L-cysteine desulfidase [Fusobacterium naviforme]|uniref:UPF0597 protein J2S20_002042 n=1 Tax=Moryella indoligenes TaxID=371674 RepID=A0AAE4AM63_9FIRM|nr:L-serine ammonia-lyase, iron-sulfur-dependent, subunit alpha [Moryella indoligenes]KAB0576697.1 serine dehydratase subunit alpha family protein [Fusobacterium naviforme]MDQ0153327.1 L-cysteine desulfidase [Moryella indoligenes]PSL08750.1 L-cysteine desulfidase [Fusobacterium naviforme]STO26724.1 Serine dehydratase alpha chain [Fusobacterium naviforme]